MPLTVNESKASFSLSGADVEPDHWAWPLAGPTERLGYYRALAKRCYHWKIAELAAGVGVNGRKLRPVKPESRHDGAQGPPLSPHAAASRFQAKLRTFAAIDRCTLYWTDQWSRAVRGHMIGWGHLPIRNVVGLTKPHQKRAIAEARTEWAAAHGLAAPPARRRKEA